MSANQQYLLDLYRTARHGETPPPAPGTGDRQAVRELRTWWAFLAVVDERVAARRARWTRWAQWTTALRPARPVRTAAVARPSADRSAAPAPVQPVQPVQPLQERSDRVANGCGSPCER
ncbi:hypothetical protein ACFYZH_18645 [Streptomyces abikoensis]|uniref:hypothetical protein n=1 Tax=Streptomyces abikoensis TaxID=97398 RepID=UPI0036C9AEB6